MEQKLRHYERLSPELAVLVETPNINNPSTLMTDYLVTGARGWDWLCQLHPKAVIMDLEDPSACKTAADELVEFPSVVRAFDDGVGFYFVVTTLGVESKAYVDALEAKIKDPNATAEIPKQTLKLDIPADCEDPVGYVNGVLKNFVAMSNMPREQVAVEFRTISDAQRSQFYKEVGGDINIEDAYPKPGEETNYPRGLTPEMIYVDDAGWLDKSENTVNNEGKEKVAFLNEPPKVVDIAIKDSDVIAVDMVKEYTPFIRDWAKARNIIGGGSSTLDQFIKGLTEAGELWTHIGKGQRELLKDDIGDIYVCLVNAAGNLDINLEDAVRPLEAYNVHSGRASYQAKGLKRWSLQVLYNMAAVAQSIENILDADNERDIDFFKTDFSEACADVVYVLETIALEQEWSLSECVIAAYEDIKDRRGLMNDGCFVKEKDFTHDMVKRVLAEDATTEGTREYLNTWLDTNRAESIGEASQPAPVEGVVSAPAPVAVETKKPFWRIWNDAQGNKENLAPFALSAEVAHLLSNQKDDQIAVTLGVFGQVNHNHEVFLMDVNDIKAAMERLVGKTVGEVANPKHEAGQDITSWLERVGTVDQSNAAGVLVGYAVNELGNGEHGPIIEVVGLVDPSALTKDRVATAGHVHFGIRAVVVAKEKIAKPDIVTTNHVCNLVCFDLSIENPRQLIK